MQRKKKIDLLRDIWVNGVLARVLWWLNEILFTADYIEQWKITDLIKTYIKLFYSFTLFIYLFIEEIVQDN